MSSPIFKRTRTGFNNILIFNIVLPVNTPKIVARFIATGRDHGSFYIEDETSGNIFEHVDVHYPASASNIHKEITEEIKQILSHYKVSLSTCAEDQLKALIRECFQKIESRYGNHVEEYWQEDGHEADAVIVFNQSSDIPACKEFNVTDFGDIDER